MKLSALLTRAKGRDFYDAMFLLMRTKPDYGYLSFREGIHDAAELKAAFVQKLAEVDINNKKRDVEHLLFTAAAAEKIPAFGDFVERMFK